MRGLLADVNAVGQLHAIVAVCRSPEWLDLWNDLGINAYTFDDIGLDPRTPDDILWDCCQRERLVLVTGNRNADGDRSLTNAIREKATLDNLPVFTVGNIQRVTADREYCNRCAIRMLELLHDMDRIIGCGRVFLP